jgi:hypothetical protein
MTQQAKRLSEERLAEIRRAFKGMAWGATAELIGHISALQSDLTAAKEAGRREAKVLQGFLDDLEKSEATYRKTHDLRGDGHRDTGHAWDVMRRSGDRARELLAQIKEKHDADSA